MTTVKTTTICLFLATFLACNNSARKKHNTLSKTEANISYIDGHYIIDTSAILDNRNLHTLLDDLSESELIEKKTVSEIPSFIKFFLDSVTGNFLIASPGEDWQVSCIVMGKQIQKKIYDKKTGDTLIQITFDNSEPLPARQLNYFGLGKDIALMKYYTGGIAKIEHILIFKFQNANIIDFWSGTGGIFNDKANKQEIITFLRNNINKEWGLNTNIIYL